MEEQDETSEIYTDVIKKLIVIAVRCRFRDFFSLFVAKESRAIGKTPINIS